jgi:thiamine-monophosphate kinase
VDEFATIARLFEPLARGEPGALGLTDDAAVLAVASGRRLVVTTDVIVEGVHYLADDPAPLVARKLVRANLSDLAAMGARPRHYLVGLALRSPVSEPWLEGFAEGLAADQAAYGIVLVGGDTTAHDGPTVLALTALGEVEEGRELRRGGARDGDRIWVSGTIGDGILGLRALRGALGHLDPDHRAYLADRYRLPRPRVELGPRLVGLAHAAIDVSDGLIADLGHVCATSGLGAVVAVDRVPLSAAAREAVSADSSLRDAILSGGDDYELLFTAPRKADEALRALSSALDLPLTPIGAMTRDPALVLEEPDGTRRPAPRRGGWTHF